MSFVQLEFVVFFVAVFALYWAVGRRRGQNALLALASAVFYGWVHPWFLLLLYGSATLDYLNGLGMARWPTRRRWFLVASLAGNLGLLGTFKYFDFFVANTAAALELLGVSTSLHTLGIFLPVGISFYTFQTMSYTLDIYRGKLEPRTNYLDYVVFVSFFPQLVAGPIERAANLLPQVEKDRHLTLDAVRSGVGLALWGAFKKVAIADTLAPYVDQIFALSDPWGPIVWVGAIGFSIQILADFSGYTDIARGTARLLGFELQENFRHPYLATDPSDYWRRWHVSFSTWIRDYLYIPLGGSRGGFVATLWATSVALILSGFWHGANWNFVLWGAFHAALITGYRVVGPWVPAVLKSRPGAVVLMYGFTVLGYLIFRETRLDQLVVDLTLNPFVATPDQWVATLSVLGVCLGCAAPLVLALAVERWVLPRLAGPWMLPAQTTAWTAFVLGIYTFGRSGTQDFIYFQF